MAIPANSIMMVTLRGSYENQTILFTRHYMLRDTIVGDIDPQGLQEQFYNQIKDAADYDIVTPYLDCLPSNYDHVETRTQLIHPVRYAFSSFLEANSGVVESPATTGNIQGAITLRTNNTGRDQVATNKIGPLPANASVGGILTNAYLVTLNSLGSALLETVIIVADPFLSTWFPVIYHPVPKVPGVYGTVVESRTAHNQTRTLSRRTVGRGI